MIIDRYTKAVLTLIAISLFVISLNPWVLPTKAYAELSNYDLSSIKSGLSIIELHVTQIATGVCVNGKIC